MLSPEGTFEYVATVPEGNTNFSCTAELLSRDATHLGKRLVGSNPCLQVSDAGVTPNPSSINPATQRSRIMLSAAERRDASSAHVSFLVDRRVIAALCPGDLLYFVRTATGSIGISAVREKQLIFAIGAITAVALGSDFEAHIPYDQVVQARSIFRESDPHFEFKELPVEIKAGGERRIVYEGRLRVGNFEIWILHGHRPGLPGKNACGSVAQKGLCSIVDANTSVLLLKNNGIEITGWS